MRLTIAAATSALVVTLALSACNSSGTSGTGAAPAASGKSWKLAGVAGNATDPYWTTLICGGTQQAKALGSTIDWKASNTPDTQDQQTGLQSVLLKNPDGLVMAAFQAGPFSAQIATLMSKGTPVVAVNGPITPETELQLVQSSTDVTPFAKTVSSSVTSGSFAVLGGQPGVPALDARWQPVVEAIKAASPGVNILSTQYDNFDINKAAQAAQSLIVAHPDLAAIYTVSGPEGQGAASAVAQAHKQGKIKVYSYDATPAIVAALKAGTITALFAQSPKNQGATAVKNLIDYLNRRTGSGPVTKATPFQVNVPTKVLTKANVDSPDAADYLYKTSCN